MKKEKDSEKTEFEFTRYASYLKEADFSEDQTRVLLETLFDIMKQFVALGFDVSALPLDYEPLACEKLEKEQTVSATKGEAVVSSNDNPSAPDVKYDHLMKRKEA